MYNSFVGAGNLAADPESRFTASGTQVAKFTVCCNSGYGDKKRTEFVRCIAWSKLAEIVTTYLHKGSKVMILGELQTRKWQDKDGRDCYTTEIIAREMKMLDGAGGRSHAEDIPSPPPFTPPSQQQEDEIPF